MMDWFVRAFIRSSLVWLGVGVLIGLSMSFWPGAALVYRPAHLHANLLGFVSMMIFGVAYHVIPRFTGRPLHRPRLAALHLWVANLGLALMVGGWLARGAGFGSGTGLLHPGAALSAAGAGLFIFNIWRTLDPLPTPVSRRAGPALPLAVPSGTAKTP